MHFPKAEIHISVIVLLVAAVFMSCENTESNNNGGGTAADSLQVSFANHNQLPERDIQIYSPDTEPRYRLSLEEESVYKHEQISSFFATDGDDRIFSWYNKGINVFREDGRIARLGGEGKGPGEFISFAAVKPKIASDRLYAFDRDLFRINVFDLEKLEPVTTIIPEPYSWSNNEDLKEYTPSPLAQFYHVVNDSTLLMGFRKPFTQGGIITGLGVGNPNPDQVQYIRYYLMNSEGEIISDRILQQKDVNFYPGTGGRTIGDIPPHLPTAPSSLAAVSPDGHIFAVWTEHFLVDVYSPEGDYLRSFYYPVEKREVDRDEIIDNYYNNPSREQLRMLRDLDFPDTWPAVHNIRVDSENRLWVATITDSNEHYRWWVLDANGELLAKTTRPGNPLKRHQAELRVRDVKNNSLYEYEEIFHREEGFTEKWITRHRLSWDEN